MDGLLVGWCGHRLKLFVCLFVCLFVLIFELLELPSDLLIILNTFESFLLMKLSEVSKVVHSNTENAKSRVHLFQCVIYDCTHGPFMSP